MLSVFWFVQLPSAVRLEIYADTILSVLSTSDFLTMPLLQSPHYYSSSWLTYVDTLPGFPSVPISCWHGTYLSSGTVSYMKLLMHLYDFYNMPS